MMRESQTGMLHRRRTEINPVSFSGAHAISNEITDYKNLHHARYASHRRKIGLSPKFSKVGDELAMARDYESRRQNLVEFIKENFKRKECVRFVPKKKNKAKPGVPEVCECGDALEKHIKWTQGVQQYFEKGAGVLDNDMSTGESGQTWSPETDIREFSTNAFGKINFINEGIGGHKPAKYVRVADNTPMDYMIGLMFQHWGMTKPTEPNLIITVIGGAKNFKLDGKKKEIFNKGLVEAAQTTHAWIITSGCNMGVMKAVGEAVAEGQTYQWDKYGMTHTLRCIGIAPWGYVEKNTCLLSKDGTGCWNAQYKVNNVIKHSHPVSLNADHTHFLLVDDGYRNSYRGVADFRANLEKKLCTPTSEGGMGKHVVLVVVEGGTDAISDVSRSLKQKIPAVLCEGTGRAADILAYAYNHFHTTRTGERRIGKKHQAYLEDMLVRAYGKTWEERSTIEKELAKYKDLVLKCCEDEKLITVFDMNKNEDLDLAILSALLKGQGATGEEQLHDQLNLALTWNRSDVAEEKIFNKDINWSQGKLDDIMTKALVDDKVNFVRLLLLNGCVMREFLTVEKLRDLYNSAPKSSNLYQLLKLETRYDKFSLSNVSKLLHKLMGKHEDDLYRNDDYHRQLMKKNEDIYNGQFTQPFKELFLWAVLMNRQDMAKFLWERGEEAIPSAIAASKIYESLANQVAHYDHELKEEYIRSKQEFENLAVKVLDECYVTDAEKAAMLIERKYQSWGGMTCLEMASSAQDQMFMSSVACQNSLDLAWKRGVNSAWYKVIPCIFLPPLVFFLITFEDLGDTQGIKGCQKLLTFYKSPITKFWSNVVMFIFFLILYSYVILFDLKESNISVTEAVALIWIFTMAMEEVREMFFLSTSESPLERLRVWWNFSMFNRIDMIILCIALIGIILRSIDGYLPEAKIFYTINCVLFFVRALSFYSASSYLGPKLVMITRMVKELMLYVMILMVFLLAYGISIQSLQYPDRAFTPKVFKGILYYPYWQIYGELFLEELEGRTDDCLANDTAIMSDGNPCPKYHWMVPLLTAGYLLIGNVLLVNLLIAIFTHVFEEVEQNSIQIWKFGMYFLVVEYDVKPGLAPPFVLFEHIFLSLRWICKRTCCTGNDQIDTLSDRHKLLLNVFEKEMQKNYLQKYQAFTRDTVELKINKIRYRVDEVAKILEEDRFLEHHHFESEAAVTHESPKHARSPRNSVSIHPDQEKLKLGSNWNLKVVSDIPAEMLLESKPLSQIEGDGPRLEVPQSPRISPKHIPEIHQAPPQPGSSRQLEKKISNLDRQQSRDAKSDVENSHVFEDNDYNKLDFDKARQLEEDPDYGPVSLTRGQKPVEEEESEDEITRIKRKHKKKKKRKDEERVTESKEGYETIKSVKDEPPAHAVDLRRRAVLPHPPVNPGEETPVAAPGLVLERRMTDLEENTKQQLQTIESLLRNVMFTRGPEETPTYQQTPQPRQPTMVAPPSPAQPRPAFNTTYRHLPHPQSGVGYPLQPAQLRYGFPPTTPGASVGRGKTLLLPGQTPTAYTPRLLPRYTSEYPDLEHDLDV